MQYLCKYHLFYMNNKVVCIHITNSCILVLYNHTKIHALPFSLYLVLIILNKQAYSLMTVCYYCVTYKFPSGSALYSLPECQGIPCSKQATYRITLLSLKHQIWRCFKQGVPWHSGKLQSVNSLWNSCMTR